MAGLNHQACGVLDLTSAARCPDRAPLKHSKQDEKPDLGQESDSRDRDRKEPVCTTGLGAVPAQVIKDFKISHEWNGCKATAFAREVLYRSYEVPRRNQKSRIRQQGSVKMANPHPEDKSTQTAEEAVRRTSERTAEQTKRIAETAVETGQEVVQSGADLLQQNAQTLQNALRFGMSTTTALMGRSTDQVSRTMGLSGNDVQQVTERSARNAVSVLHTTAAVAKVMNDMSREYFAFVQHQMESTMDRMSELWGCRTPQDVAAVQSELVRHTVESAVESTRRIADMSLKATDAAKQMAQNIERRAA
jgi:hypothetical protein